MSMFGKFADAQSAMYDPENDIAKPMRVKNDRADYVNHECNLICSVQEIRAGRVDNQGSNIDKHHFVSVRYAIERVISQSPHMPQSKVDQDAGAEPKDAPVLKEGDECEIFIKLPRHIHSDPTEYAVDEFRMIEDLCEFFGALFGVVPAAVNLSILDAITDNDGADLKGDLFGVKYTSYSPKKKPERVYTNPRAYCVDDEGTPSTPMTVEEVKAALAAG